MNQKDKKNIGISWAFVLFAAILGFFVNIISSSVFDMYANSFRPRVVAIFIFSLVVSIFVVGFLSYIFENIESIKKEEGLRKIMIKYVKSWFKR